MQQQHFIRGQWVSGLDETHFDSHDPVYGHRVWSGPAAGLLTTADAVQAARAAFEPWSETDFQTRLNTLQAYTQALTERKDELAKTIAQETGKVLWEAKQEVAGMLGKLAVSQDAYQNRTSTQTFPGSPQGVLRFKPHGVIAILGPFNFPGHLPHGQLVPALLAGNTIVFKPSEQAPAVADIMMQALAAADFPPGVINLIQGNGQTGADLVAHPNVDGVFFTGSAHVGMHIHKTLGGHPEKILALEMGGNNPLLAFDVQDKTACAYHIMQSAYLTAGQRCVCARRLIIPEGAEGDQIIEALLKQLNALHVDAYDAAEQPFYSSLVSPQAAEKALSFLQSRVDMGATVLNDMKLLKPNTGILSPGLIDVTDIADLPDDECFGPLLQVIRVKDFDTGIRTANQTRYGLSAGILTDDQEKYQCFLSRSRAGIVNWNRQTTGASAKMPFGGVGISGNHRPAGYYMGDACVYPVASMEANVLTVPDNLSPGIVVSNVGAEAR